MYMRAIQTLSFPKLMGILKTILLLLGPKGAAMHLSVDLFHIKRTTRLDNAKDHFLESIVMIFYLQCFS